MVSYLILLPLYEELARGVHSQYRRNGKFLNKLAISIDANKRTKGVQREDHQIKQEILLMINTIFLKR